MRALLLALVLILSGCQGLKPPARDLPGPLGRP